MSPQHHVSGYPITENMICTIGQFDVGLSTTAYKMWGGISGGSLSTMITMLEDVPKEKRRESRVDYVLSPGICTVFYFVPELTVRHVLDSYRRNMSEIPIIL